MALYDAFISYSHAKDKPIASAIQAVIQKLGKPWYRRRALRVFRDDTSLSATPSLWPSIEKALSDSRFLILFASPEAAASQWVSKEVLYWLNNKSPDTLLIAVTAGEIDWDDAAGDFLWPSTTCLPTVMVGRFRAQPKWIDLRSYSGAAKLSGAKFREQGADFAAAIRGIAKEDLLSEEVSQQRRALALAWSAVGSLLVLTGVAGWQWNNALVAQQAALESERIAIERRDEAQRERDRAQRAFLDSSARESLQLVRDGRAEDAFEGLRRALNSIKEQMPRSLPLSVAEAALTALIENRFGPEASLALSDERKKGLIREYYEDEPTVLAAFDPLGERVAIHRERDVVIMWTRSEKPLQQLAFDQQIAAVRFHDKEDILVAIGMDGDTILVDLASGGRRILKSQQCRKVLRCIAGPGAENGKLVSLYAYTPLADVIKFGISTQALLLFESDPVANRYHIWPQGRDLIVFDTITQQVARTPWSHSDSRFVVARDKPVMAIAEDDTILVFQLDIDPRNSTRIAVKQIRKFQADELIKDIALNDEGTLLYYSTRNLGNAGRGGRTAGALDLQSGQSAWTIQFQGHTVYGPRQTYVARSRFDRRTGLTLTQFVNGRTAEPLFTVPGAAVAFDPTGRFALIEGITNYRSSPRDLESDWMKVAPTRLRLVELSKIDSFAYEGRDAEGMRDDCEIGNIALRTLADREDRWWSAYDWRRVAEPRELPRGAIGLVPPEPGGGPEQADYRLEWSAGKGKFSRTGDANEVLASGSRDEIAKLAPGWGELIVADTDIDFTEIKSANGKFASVARRFWSGARTNDWSIYRIEQGKWEMITHGSFQPGRRPWDNKITLLEGLASFAVHDEPCSLTFVGVPEGKIIGKVTPAYGQVVSVAAIAGDLVFVITSGDRDGRSSIQIFDFPDLNPGPWFLTGNESLEDGGGGTDQQAARERLVNKRALMLYDWGQSSVSEDGQTLFLKPDQSEWVALSVPPWGRRLRQLLLPQ